MSEYPPKSILKGAQPNNIMVPLITRSVMIIAIIGASACLDRQQNVVEAYGGLAFVNNTHGPSRDSRYAPCLRKLSVLPKIVGFVIQTKPNRVNAGYFDVPIQTNKRTHNSYCCAAAYVPSLCTTQPKAERHDVKPDAVKYP